MSNAFGGWDFFTESKHCRCRVRKRRRGFCFWDCVEGFEWGLGKERCGVRKDGEAIEDEEEEKKS